MSINNTSTLTGFGLANFRSFDEEGFLVNDLRKINVFIGKNNSGKSNILHAIRLLRKITAPNMNQGSALGLKQEIDSHARNGLPPSATVIIRKAVLTDAEEPWLDRWRKISGDYLTVRWNTKSGELDKPFPHGELEVKDLIKLHNLITGGRTLGSPQRSHLLSNLAGPILQRSVQSLRKFDRLISTENFREIREAPGDKTDPETFNGYNVIPQLREMQIPKVGNEVENEVFVRIQQFVRELLGEDDLVMSVPNSEELIAIKLHGTRLPLESYGTGVHQLVILCAALAMHDDHVVCIEEPEIHIHPELQRKFLRFIANET